MSRTKKPSLATAMRIRQVRQTLACIAPAACGCGVACALAHAQLGIEVVPYAVAFGSSSRHGERGPVVRQKRPPGHDRTQDARVRRGSRGVNIPSGAGGSGVRCTGAAAAMGTSHRRSTEYQEQQVRRALQAEPAKAAGVCGWCSAGAGQVLTRQPRRRACRRDVQRSRALIVHTTQGATQQRSKSRSPPRDGHVGGGGGSRCRRHAGTWGR